jgi:hypothetical protein
LCADIAIHKGLLIESKRNSSIEAVFERQSNPHAHIILPFRTVNGCGFAKTKTQLRYMNRSSYLVQLRKEWARMQNREFIKLGLEIRVSHESYAVQGIKREPTKHLGSKVMALELKGIKTDRGDEYREILTRNKEREIERMHTRARNHELTREYERSQ